MAAPSSVVSIRLIRLHSRFAGRRVGPRFRRLLASNDVSTFHGEGLPGTWPTFMRANPGSIRAADQATTVTAARSFAGKFVLVRRLTSTGVPLMVTRDGDRLRPTRLRAWRCFRARVSGPSWRHGFAGGGPVGGRRRRFQGGDLVERRQLPRSRKSRGSTREPLEAPLVDRVPPERRRPAVRRFGPLVQKLQIGRHRRRRSGVVGLIGDGLGG